MPAPEIKELRIAGRLDEAYTMALSELEVDKTNIWGKRNLSWVIYAQLDRLSDNLPEFLIKIEEVKKLDLPITEEMFFDNISIVVAKAAREINKHEPIDIKKLEKLFDAIKELPIKRNTKWYSSLFSAFQKGMKESSRYPEFADWWDFSNFLPEDFQKYKMDNGIEIMAIAEQGYITYAKHLLPQKNSIGEIVFDREKANSFLPILTKIAESYPKFQYPPYFQGKLLLALGEKDNFLSALLPFAKKKQNDFWVWEIIAEAFVNEPDKFFACYCKALLCFSPETMLVGIRQKMAKLLIERKLFNEAKTEIDIIVNTKKNNNNPIPNIILNWQKQDWYNRAITQSNNVKLYTEFSLLATSLLFFDVKEEAVMVEFVNSDRRVLNFIGYDDKHGYFKYDRFLKSVAKNDILLVRFQEGTLGGSYKIYTASKDLSNTNLQFFEKQIEGTLRIPSGQSFGFVEDVFVLPTIISKMNYSSGDKIKGTAKKTIEYKTKKVGWKLI